MDQARIASASRQASATAEARKTVIAITIGCISGLHVLHAALLLPQRTVSGVDDLLPWSLIAEHFFHSAIQTVEALQADLGLTSFLTPEVNHRGKAYGLVMQHQTGWKISWVDVHLDSLQRFPELRFYRYSGDTMPCDRLIETGRDSTLLIHEATLEDTAVDMALAKGHSTFGQAIDVGSK